MKLKHEFNGQVVKGRECMGFHFEDILVFEEY